MSNLTVFNEVTSNKFEIYFSRVFDATTIVTISLLVLALLITVYDNKRFKEWKYNIHIFGCFVVFFGLTTLMEALFFAYLSEFMSFVRSPLALSNIVVVFIFSGIFMFPKEKNLISPIVKTLVLASATMMVNCMSNHLGRAVGFLTENTPIIVLFRFFPFIFLGVITLAFRSFDVSKYSKLSWIFGVTSIALSVSLIAIGLFDDYGGLEDIGIHFFLFAIYFLVLASDILAYIAMCVAQKNLRQSVRNQAEATVYSSEAKMMEISKSELDLLREMRHELKNQYSYMSILLKEERYEELNKFFGEMDKDFMENIGLVDCGNKLVSSIINMELAKAKANNVTLEHVEVVPPMLPYDQVSLSSLISNVIDNAIEAIVREDAEDRTIQFSIITYQEYLRICCKNKTKSTNVKLKTTKTESGHGYGTKIIKKIAQKYNGTADFIIEDGVFIVDAILHLEHQEEEDKKNA